MDCKQALERLKYQPYLVGHALGFTDLTELNNEWIVDMVTAKEDKTLQAHRGSYKTTCVSIALAIIMIVFPNITILFMRKTDTDVKEIVSQVAKILQSQVIQYFVTAIYGVELELTVCNATELSTNLQNTTKGTNQLTALGIGSSITGKHYDIIFTDDIVNKEDRKSRAEREKTKSAYYELHNIKNRSGRIYNTGTPWHKEDAFTLMPEPKKYDCYSTGLIDDEKLQELRDEMTASLFAANYELRHIASDDVIFPNPKFEKDASMVEQGRCHIDAAYGGEDYTAFTICNKRDGIFYIFGKMWQKHVDDCLEEILMWREHFNAGRISCEDNADKGYLAKDLRSRKILVKSYHESQNKYIKIVTYGKKHWKNVRFVAGTDQEYINMICDYTENAEHDDAPDSMASIIREMAGKKERTSNNASYFS